MAMITLSRTVVSVNFLFYRHQHVAHVVVALINRKLRFWRKRAQISRSDPCLDRHSHSTLGILSTTKSCVSVYEMIKCSDRH